MVIAVPFNVFECSEFIVDCVVNYFFSAVMDFQVFYWHGWRNVKSGATLFQTRISQQLLDGLK